MSARMYEISGVMLASEIAMPELARRESAAPDWTFAIAERRIAPPASTWFHVWRGAGGRRVVSFGRDPRGYLLRFHGKADFIVDLTQRSIVCWRRVRASLATVRHLLLDQVMPLVLSRDSRLVLHAAAIATPRGAVAFVGPTGSGKSTLAAAVAALGFPLLCDDCLVVESSMGGFLAGSFYPGARLYPDSVRAVGMAGVPSSSVGRFSSKRRISSDRLPFLGQSAPLAGVFMLEGAPRRSAREALHVTPLSSRDALVALIGCTFHLDVGDSAAVRRGFEMQSRLVRQTPVSRLSYPWRLNRLEETR
ncbi:MAG TPA: hypothetical protein VKI43_02855, partial [Vicinamibacterales bacterium]|nr:hypothetical protein [Vicinamibacterales bacterium]